MDKYINFLDLNGGVWHCDINIKRGINFRAVLQRAIAIENAMGGKLLIILTDGKTERDITDWVKRMGK